MHKTFNFKQNRETKLEQNLSYASFEITKQHYAKILYSVVKKTLDWKASL